jgi:hypothetical protein
MKSLVQELRFGIDFWVIGEEANDVLGCKAVKVIQKLGTVQPGGFTGVFAT